MAVLDFTEGVGEDWRGEGVSLTGTLGTGACPIAILPVPRVSLESDWSVSQTHTLRHW